MTTKKVLICAGALLGLLAGSVQAGTSTGPVGYYFIQEYSGSQSYTFINNGSVVCYYIGTNTAYATIFAAKQISGKSVTITCDTSSKLTGLAN